MNKRDMMYALAQVDACIDCAEMQPLLLALQALRELLLYCWQDDACCVASPDELLHALESLPEMCGMLNTHPALPMKLSQVMLLLCMPVFDAAQHPKLRCSKQAERIRRLRCCQQEMLPLLAGYERDVREETEKQHHDALQIMDEVFRQCLGLHRISILAAVASSRKKRMTEIEQCRKVLRLEDVADAVTQSQTDCEWVKENLYNCIADMEAAGFFNNMKDRQK